MNRTRKRFTSILLIFTMICSMLTISTEAVSGNTVAANGTYSARGEVDFLFDQYIFQLTLTVANGKISQISQQYTTTPQEEDSEDYHSEALTKLQQALIGQPATVNAVDAVTSGTPKYSYEAMAAAAKSALEKAASASSGGNASAVTDGLYQDNSVATVGLADNYTPSLTIRVQNGIITAIDATANTISVNLSFLQTALTGIRAQIVGQAATMSTIEGIDAVTNATVSTDAIREEAKLALAKEPEEEGYTVSYNLNGAPGNVPDTAIYAPGATVRVINDPVWKNHIFNGWSGVEITNGQFTMPYENVTLTAQWTETHENGVYTDDSVIEEVFYRYQFITAADIYNDQIVSISVDVYDTEEETPVNEEDLEWLLEMSEAMEYINRIVLYEDATYEALEPLYYAASIGAGMTYEEDGIEYTIPLNAQYIILEIMNALEGEPTTADLKAGSSSTVKAANSYTTRINYFGCGLELEKTYRISYALYDSNGRMLSVKMSNIVFRNHSFFAPITIQNAQNGRTCKIFLTDGTSPAAPMAQASFRN